MKKMRGIFWLIAALLSCGMCFVVGFQYRDMLCGIAHAGYSAPAETAFLYAIPFVIGIAVCVVLAIFASKK